MHVREDFSSTNDIFIFLTRGGWKSYR